MDAVVMAGALAAWKRYVENAPPKGAEIARPTKARLMAHGSAYAITEAWLFPQARPVAADAHAAPGHWPGLIRGDVVTIPAAELEAAGGDLMACPSAYAAQEG